MTNYKVKYVEQPDRQKALETILISFSSDPFVRWFWPKASDYVNCIPAFEAFGGGAIDHGSAYTTNDFEGVALWFPPGFGPNEGDFVSFLEKTAAADSLEDGFRVFEAMEQYHPKEPCWYLPLIGVDPIHQGKGIGSALMKYALERCDEQGISSYLESTNPKNISLYERYGFEVMGEIKFGKCPVVTPMVRSYRS